MKNVQLFEPSCRISERSYGTDQAADRQFPWTFPPPVLETADTPIVHGDSPAHYADKMMFIGVPMYFNISFNFFYIFAFCQIVIFAVSMLAQ